MHMRLTLHAALVPGAGVDRLRRSSGVACVAWMRVRAPGVVRCGTVLNRGCVRRPQVSQRCPSVDEPLTPR